MLDLPAARQSKSLARSEEANAHVERVLTIADRDASAPSDDEVTTSWQRSAKVHRVDPESGEAPRILTSSELNILREPLAKLIVDAREQLDHLYGIVQHAGYTVLLCNDQGVAVEHRGNEAEADQFKYWGTWLGGVWAEEVEGTNGIGTCIVHEHPITSTALSTFAPEIFRSAALARRSSPTTGSWRRFWMFRRLILLYLKHPTP
jgi:transcriptional regulator of acetoin/glycerol metabolism